MTVLMYCQRHLCTVKNQEDKKISNLAQDKIDSILVTIIY